MDDDKLWERYTKEYNCEWMNEHEGLRKSVENSYGYDRFLLGVAIDELESVIVSKIEKILRL